MTNWFLSVDWIAVAQAAASVATLMVALKALNTWRSQKRTDRVVSLIDEITDAIHEFIQGIATPIQILDFIHIGIESKKFDSGLNPKTKHPQAIRFIETDGSKYASQLMSELSACQPIAHRIESLLVKAQIFSINGFRECDEACRLIIWQYQRLTSVYAMLSSPNLNWEHPKISQNLDNVLDITPDSIRTYLAENQIVALNFLRDLYASELNISIKAKK